MKSLNNLAEESGLEWLFHAKPRTHTQSRSLYYTHDKVHTHCTQRADLARPEGSGVQTTTYTSLGNDKAV